MAYGPQFTEMLLNKQGRQAEIDQRAALENAQIQQKQQEQLLGAMSQAGTSIAGSLKTAKDNGIANNLMNQNDPNYQATVGDDGQSDGSVSPHTGGVDEMNLQMQMDRQKQAQMQAQLLQSHANYYDQIPTIRQAQSAANALTADQKAKWAASMNYEKQLGVYMKSLTGAKNQAVYDNAAQAINGLYNATQAMGIKTIQKPAIQPYAPGAASGMNPDGNPGLAGYPGKQGGWFGWGKQEEIPAHTAPLAPDTASPTGSAGNGGVQEGTVIQNGSGQTMIYQNGAWVNQ